MKNTSRQSITRRWVFRICLSASAVAVLVAGVRWGHLKSVPPVKVLAEVARTNLTLRADGWCRNGETNLFTGLLVDYYPGGQLMSRSVVSNGLLNGLSEGWYTNRQLQVRETYRANFSDGLRTRWYANGNKLSEATVVHGKMNGVYRRWYDDGTLAEEIPMKDGQIEGEGRAFYKSGFVKAAVKYEGGKAVQQQTWKDGEHKGG